MDNLLRTYGLANNLSKAYCFLCLWYLAQCFFEYLFRVRIPSLWLFYLLRAYWTYSHFFVLFCTYFDQINKTKVHWYTLEYLLRGIPFDIMKVKGQRSLNSNAFHNYLHNHARVMALYMQQAPPDIHNQFIHITIPLVYWQKWVTTTTRIWEWGLASCIILPPSSWVHNWPHTQDYSSQSESPVGFHLALSYFRLPLLTVVLMVKITYFKIITRSLCYPLKWPTKMGNWW